jgi:H+-transporting ATPase
VATLIAVYGLFMTPLGWGRALFVWGYALVWFLVNDRVKLLAYRIFDPVKTKSKPETKSEAKPEAKAKTKAEDKDDRKPEVKAESKAEPKPDAKPEVNSEAKVEPKPEDKTEPTLEAKAKSPSDLTPQIAKRAYELYEQRGRQDGRAVQDWLQAEREVRKDEAKEEGQKLK